MDQTKIIVDAARFNVGDEYNWLAQSDADGAVVTLPAKCAITIWVITSAR